MYIIYKKNNQNGLITLTKSSIQSSMSTIWEKLIMNSEVVIY